MAACRRAARVLCAVHCVVEHDNVTKYAFESFFGQ